MDATSLSIVTATYQRPEDTAELVQSVRKSYRNFKEKSNDQFDLEMIVICDKEDRDTLQKLSQIEWSSLNIVKSNNHMLSYNRELGIQKAKYEFIASLDSDCIVINNWVKNVYEAITDLEGSSSFIQGAYYFDWPENQNWFTKAEAAEDRSRFKDRQADSRNIIMNKDLYRKIGGYEIRYKYSGVAEDLMLKKRVERAGGELVFDKSIKVQHKYSDNLLDNLRRYKGFGKGAIHIKEKEPELFYNKYGPVPQATSAIRNIVLSIALRNEKRSILRSLYLIMKTFFYIQGYFVGRYVYWLERNFNQPSLRKIISNYR